MTTALSTRPPAICTVSDSGLCRDPMTHGDLRPGPVSVLSVSTAAAVVPEPSSLTWTAAVLAWVLAVPLFVVTRFVTVVAHEAGHAIVAVALLRAVHAIRFDRRSNGVTVHDRAMWPFGILIAAAGYLGPSLFGLLAAWLLIRGETAAVLWGSIAFLAVMLLAVRGIVGLLLVPALAVVLYQVATKAEPPTQALFAHVWTWFLLISAVQRMLLFMSTANYDAPGNDTASLSSDTLLPRALWGLILLAGTIAALVWGGAMLLRLTG